MITDVHLPDNVEWLQMFIYQIEHGEKGGMWEGNEIQYAQSSVATLGKYIKL